MVGKVIKQTKVLTAKNCLGGKGCGPNTATSLMLNVRGQFDETF